MSPDRPRLIPDCDEAENDRLVNAIADHLEAEMDRSGPPRPRARIAEVQATIDRRVAEDQRRILERHKNNQRRVTVEDVERVLGYIPDISCWCRGDCLDSRRCWAEHLEAGGAPPEAYLGALDKKNSESQRILERHAAAAREWPGGEAINEEPPGFVQFMLGAFVGSILGLLAGIGMSLLVQGVL